MRAHTGDVYAREFLQITISKNNINYFCALIGMSHIQVLAAGIVVSSLVMTGRVIPVRMTLNDVLNIPSSNK
jgi:hypothetical protein